MAEDNKIKAIIFDWGRTLYNSGNKKHLPENILKWLWLQKGKYSQNLPNEETGQPTYIIEHLSELKNLL